jgi:hypothetical protein
MTTIGEDMPKQQARVREVLGHYREIGPAGAFGAAMIEQALRDADAALASGDIVRIIAAYQALVEIKS